MAACRTRSRRGQLHNWWSTATSAVKRSLFLDNFVYSVSDSELRVRDINAMTNRCS